MRRAKRAWPWLTGLGDLSGPLENPKTSTLDVVLNLVRNAFFEAILPGFERRRGNGG